LKPTPVKPKNELQAHLLPGSTAGQDNQLSEIWRNPWARRATAVAVPALVALPLAFAMPRGPITTGEALATMIVGLIVGYATQRYGRPPQPA